MKWTSTNKPPDKAGKYILADHISVYEGRWSGTRGFYCFKVVEHENGEVEKIYLDCNGCATHWIPYPENPNKF